MPARSVTAYLLRGYRGGSPTAVRPSEPALCGSCPLVTPYYCRLGDLLCFMYVYRYSCLLLSMHVCFVLFPLFDLSFVDFPSVLRYCWLCLLTCKNRLPYNLYCVGGDVKHCTIQSNTAYLLVISPSCNTFRHLLLTLLHSLKVPPARIFLTYSGFPLNIG